MYRFPDRLLRALGLVSLMLLSACASLSSDFCSQDTLPGRWKTDWTEEFWTFAANGRLSCEGNCYYGATVGKPQAWSYEPEASLWSTPIDHIKLVFTEKAFDGTLGAYRCAVDRDGRRLTLRPFNGEVLVFERAGEE